MRITTTFSRSALGRLAPLSLGALWILSMLTLVSCGGGGGSGGAAAPQVGIGDAAVVEVSPYLGESGVSLKREATLILSGTVRRDTVNSESISVWNGTQRVLDALPYLHAERNRISVFTESYWPSGALLELRVEDGKILADNGRPLDADSDGIVGGSLRVPFRVVDVERVANTEVCGRVFASEVGGSGLDVPLAGVKVVCDGIEDECFAFTDSLGNFCLQDAPAGDIFVRILGTQSSGAPAGFFYPDVGKLWHSVAGQRVTVGTVYLPAIAASSLVPMSRTQPTVVQMGQEQLSRVPDPKLRELLRQTRIEVPADSLFDDHGVRGGSVGIAPVNPDRLPAPLPEGLSFPLVITVQTSGPRNFDRVVPMTMPNLPDPLTGELLPPGAKSALWSFNHDTGRFEVVGPMTVSSDGLTVTTDPGVGLRAPGWHAPAPGTPATGRPPLDLPTDDPQPNDPPNNEPPCNLSTWQAINLGYSVAGDVAECAVEVTNVRQAYNCWMAWRGFVGAILQQVDTLKTTLERDRTQISRAVAAQILGDLVEKKNAAIDLLECTEAVDPATKISQIVTCLQSAVSIADTICELNDGACVPASVRTPLCATVAYGQQLLTQVTGWLTIVREWKDGAKAQLVCAAVENTIRLLQFVLEQQESGGSGVVITEAQVDELLSLLGAVGPAVVAEGGVQSAFAGASASDQGLNTFASDLPRHLSALAGLRGIPRPAPYLYALTIGDSLPRRGEATDQGTLSLTLGARRFYRIAYYDPWRNRFAFSTGRTANEGQATEFNRAPMLSTAGMPDADSDGMPDDAEFVVGTSPQQADTDDDGVSDYDEVRAGSDPLDGVGGRERVLADLAAAGPVADISADDGALVAACGSAGIEVFSVWQNMEPTSVARLDTPGDAQRVAISGLRVAVADGAAGLALVDLSVPAQPRIAQQIALGDVRSVSAQAGVAIAATDSGALSAVDLAQGIVLSTRSIGQPVVDVLLDGEWVYALTNTELRVLRLSYGQLVDISSAALGRSGHVRLARAQQRVVTIHQSGCVVVDVSNPNVPQVQAATDSTFQGWRHLALDGSGNAVCAIGSGVTIEELALFRLEDFSQPGFFVRDFTGSDFPNLADAIVSSVVVYNGLAYVGDRRGRLFCVRYRLRDLETEPPQVTVTTTASGNQIEEGKAFVLSALATDDVQISHVDFEVDGARLVSDGTYPFQARLQAPPRGQQPTMTLGAKCWDTGGNLAMAQTVTLQVTADVTAPTLVRRVPVEAGIARAGRPLDVIAYVDEPLDAFAVSVGNVTCVGAGPDGLFDSADDVPLPMVTAQWRQELMAAIWSSSANLTEQRYRVRLSGLRDVAGNVLPQATWTFEAQETMVLIQPGTFLMGSMAGDVPERPVHPVTITRPFWVGRYEVTQAEYQAVMGSNPSRFQGASYPNASQRPVEQVSWNNAMAYCAALTATEAAAGRIPAGYQYRLPTEAEWEYCCRAGTTTEFSFGPSLTCGMANFCNEVALVCCVGQTSAVGSYPANPWGLFDMHGNVWEWCLDSWDGTANYPSSAVSDPYVSSGPIRVFRGGNWFDYSDLCRSAARDGVYPGDTFRDLGFRVCLAPVLVP